MSGSIRRRRRIAPVVADAFPDRARPRATSSQESSRHSSGRSWAHWLAACSADSAPAWAFLVIAAVLIVSSVPDATAAVRPARRGRRPFPQRLRHDANWSSWADRLARVRFSLAQILWVTAYGAPADIPGPVRRPCAWARRRRREPPGPRLRHAHRRRDADRRPFGYDQVAPGLLFGVALMGVGAPDHSRPGEAKTASSVAGRPNTADRRALIAQVTVRRRCDAQAFWAEVEQAPERDSGAGLVELGASRLLDYSLPEAAADRLTISATSRRWGSGGRCWLR